jgi:hypothetical protein
VQFDLCSHVFTQYINTEHGTEYSGFLQHCKSLSVEIDLTKLNVAYLFEILECFNISETNFFAAGKLYFVARVELIVITLKFDQIFIFCSVSDLT